jgi:hypothetical protein
MPGSNDVLDEPVSISPSILRLSAWQRLAVACALISALWAAVHWALQ